jgi:LytS/YehU family sensor histidine kinase
MLTRLSNILRHNLRGDASHTVPLESEINVVSDYLALEAVRFEERLRVRYDIDPALHTAQVPPLLLQTLVENAIKHGIAQAPTGGDLVIRAMRQQDTVRLEVENTGKLTGSSSDDQFGLSNARQRLALIYGSRAALELKAAAGHVTALVSIPA